MRDIGKNIRTIRIESKMTQEELADALFVTRQTVSNYETGKSRPDIETLLRIAEVFHCDISIIIYGPPVPEDRQRARKRTIVSASLFAGLLMVYFIPYLLFDDIHDYDFILLRNFRNLTIRPAMLFCLGWALLQGLRTFCNLHQINSRASKYIRIILGIILCAIIILPAPLVIYKIVAFIKVVTEPSVSMTFPHIPVYTQIVMGIVYLHNKLPLFMTVLGSLCWLFGIPFKDKIKNI